MTKTLTRGKPKDAFTTEPVRLRWSIPVRGMTGAPTVTDNLLIIEKRTSGRGKSRYTRFLCKHADERPGQWWFDPEDLILASEAE